MFAVASMLLDVAELELADVDELTSAEFMEIHDLWGGVYPKLEVMENTGNSVKVVVVDEAGEGAVLVVPGIICLLFD
jgi:hypothetical protein